MSLERLCVWKAGEGPRYRTEVVGAAADRARRAVRWPILWATSGDEQVDHVRLASAAFSTLIRVLSSAAFSTVKTSAVIHAVCTRGSATPSATTAT